MFAVGLIYCNKEEKSEKNQNPKHFSFNRRAFVEFERHIKYCCNKFDGNFKRPKNWESKTQHCNNLWDIVDRHSKNRKKNPEELCLKYVELNRKGYEKRCREKQQFSNKRRKWGRGGGFGK